MTSDPAAAEVRPTLSVVVPTYREAANVPVLFERLKTTLDGLPWEMIVVDDNSPDGTADVAYAIARARSAPALPPPRQPARPRRRGDRGLAVLERRFRRGDRRRPAARRNDPAEDVRGAGRGRRATSRSARASPTETAPGGLSPARQKLSELGAWFFRLLAGATVSDPMSGFFMVQPRDRRRTGAAPVARRVQDPRRRGALVRRAAEDRRSPLCVPAAPGRRVEAVAAGRPRFPRPRRPSRDRRPAADPLRAVRLDRRGRPRRPSAGADRPDRGVRPAGFRRRPDRRDDRRHGQQFPAQQRDHLSRLPLSRPRHDRRLRCCSRCCAASARSPTSTSPRGCSAAGACGGSPGSPARWSAWCGTTRRARPSSGGAGASAEEGRPAMLQDALDSLDRHRLAAVPQGDGQVAGADRGGAARSPGSGSTGSRSISSTCSRRGWRR